MNVSSLSEDLTELTRRTAEAQSALMRGDVDGYVALTEHAKDFTLMSPFGGTPTHGFDLSRRAEVGRFFKSGTFGHSVVATYATGDLAVIVTIERVHAEVGGLPGQDWSLRVTQVFRREGTHRRATEWQIVHRHADPLANGISLEQAASLARGSQG